MSLIASYFGLALCSPISAQLSSLPGGTLRLTKGPRTYEGQALALNNESVVMLLRDGRMKLLKNEGWELERILSQNFTPFTRELMRENLQAEFGGAYQVSLTETYLVVHPPGEYQTWAQPIEETYRHFCQYFDVRGIPLESPQFPLVAVVLNTRDEFDYFLKNYQTEVASPNIVGYYSPTSNRLITYSRTGSSRSDEQRTRTTIIHELVHQAAYNAGVHNRFGATPRWFCEGLAVMFEAPGVHDAVNFPRASDRIHPSWLPHLVSHSSPGKSSGTIGELIAQDRLFRSDTSTAYAYSWGLTYFLAETMPLEYARYIGQVRRRKDFQEYSSQERIEDFLRSFGMNADEIESRMTRFLHKQN